MEKTEEKVNVIIVPIEEYKELLIIKGRFLELSKPKFISAIPIEERLKRSKHSSIVYPDMIDIFNIFK